MNVDLASRPPGDDPLSFIAKPTPPLRETVAQQQSILAPLDFHELLAAIRRTFDRYSAKLQECKAGVDRAEALHSMLDRELKEASPLETSCRKGCTGCCHYEVEILQDEAVLLKTLVTAGISVDYERLEVQSSRERQSVEWNNFGSLANRCVFLGEDGACQIYEHRPSICRRHLVRTPPGNCTQAGAQIWPVRILPVEILLSAALSIEGMSFGSLSKLLLELLRPN